MRPYTDHLISIDENDNIIFTEFGIETYRPYFGRVGIDIRDVKTYEDYIHAKRAIRHIELDDELSAYTPANINSLESQLVKAIVDGNQSEETRITDALSRKKAMGLKSVI